LVVLVLLLAVLLLAQLGKEATRLNGTDVAFTSAIDNAALEAKGVANDERGYLMSGDRRYLDEATAGIATAQSAFDRAVRGATGPQQLLIARNAAAGFDRWLDALQQEFATYESNKAAAQTASLGPTRELRKGYEAELTKAQQLGQTSVSRAASNVTVTTSRSIGILFGCLLVVLVTGLLISLWVIRLIAQPLISLAALLTG
jgi:methyl-accepting chemotaxis protein